LLAVAWDKFFPFDSSTNFSINGRET